MLDINKNKTVAAYYILLLFVLTSWTNVDSLPPFPLRLAFMLAVIVPLWINNISYFSQVFFTFVVISAASFAVSYMPVDGLYVLICIAITAMFFNKHNPTTTLNVPKSFILLAILSLFIDLFFSSGITISFNWIAIIIAAHYLINKEDASLLNLITFSFAIISIVLSIEFVIVGDRFISDVHTMIGDLDRKGWTDPNYFGSVIGMGIISSLISLFNNTNLSSKLKRFYFFTIIISLYTLFSTASRGAVVALAASASILLFLSPLKRGYKVASLFAAIIALLIMYKLHFLDLLILRFQSDEGDAGGRAYIWTTRLDAFFNQCNPLQWVLGIGRDQSLTLGTGRLLGFHNDYLSVLVRYGFIGLFCLISMLVSPIRNAVKNKGVVLAAVVYMALCMFSIEPFTGGQWGCLYFYIYILMLSQVNYEEQYI